jgi:hypothetical protein
MTVLAITPNGADQALVSTTVSIKKVKVRRTHH